MEETRSLLDLQSQHLSNTHLLLSEISWKISNKRQNEQSFSSCANCLWSHLNLATRLFIYSYHFTQQGEIDIFRAFEGNFGFFFSLALYNCQLYHPKALITHQLLATAHKRQHRGLLQGNLHVIGYPLYWNQQFGLNLIINKTWSLDPEHKIVSAFLHSLKSKLVKVFTCIILPDSKNILGQFIESLVLADNSHPNDFRVKMILFESDCEFTLMNGAGYALLEIDWVDIEGDKLIDTGSGCWIDLFCADEGGLRVEKAVGDLTKLLNHSLWML